MPMAHEALQQCEGVSLCPGEYGELLVSGGKLLEGEQPLTVSEGEVVDVLEGVLNRADVTPQCRNYALTALMKLSVRFGSQSERIKVPSHSALHLLTELSLLDVPSNPACSLSCTGRIAKPSGCRSEPGFINTGTVISCRLSFESTSVYMQPATQYAS